MQLSVTRSEVNGFDRSGAQTIKDFPRGSDNNDASVPCVFGMIGIHGANIQTRTTIISIQFTEQFTFKNPTIKSL